jgi:hypothetical protein
MKCQALPAYLFSSKNTQVTEPLSIGQTDHVLTGVAHYPGAIHVCRFVCAKSSWVFSENLVL